MSVVKINAITVEPERAEELVARFAARAGEVGGMAGFEAFELLRRTTIGTSSSSTRGGGPRRTSRPGRTAPRSVRATRRTTATVR